MYPTFINSFVVLASLSAMIGVLVHDTRIDKATIAALDATPSYHAAAHEVSTKQLVSSDFHTHTERGSLTQALHSIKTTHPRQQPRSNEDKRYVLQKRVVKGHNHFDNYNLPLA